jgi:predicted TIM-barrel fold metal-dependent hydrolase
MEKIDTHQHLLYPESFTYEWTNELPVLQRAFRIEDYDQAAESANVTHTIFMEVDVPETEFEKEAAFFSALAEEDNRLCAVIAACRPENKDFEGYLDRIAHPRLKGLRRILHTQPDALSESSAFRKNLSRIHHRNLSFDICFLQRQLDIAGDLVGSCTNTQFVLDHCGVPNVAGNGYADWLPKIKALARHENLSCKVSGIVAYTDEDTLNTDALRPYIETAIESFGWERVVWGSDWPVCNTTASLSQWTAILDEILSVESLENQAKLYAENAKRIYRLG